MSGWRVQETCLSGPLVCAWLYIRDHFETSSVTGPFKAGFPLPMA